MGQLFIINDSFELSNIVEDERDSVVGNYCKSIDLIKRNNDNLFASPELYLKQYSFGSFYDLIYKDWPGINKDGNLRGISTTTHQLYFNLLIATPGLAKYIPTLEEFNIHYKNTHKGYSGFEMQTPPQKPLISSKATWHDWKSKWLLNHQNEINWENITDEFLPNKSFIDDILLDELIKHGVLDKLHLYQGSHANTFHDEVMKKKGGQTAAYSQEIGERILEINYYSFQHQLSVKERKAAGGAFRHIYRLLSKDNKYRYISIDHKHGMFEYHDHNGKHLGEYRFDGTKNSEAEATHNLKTI